MMGLSQSIKNGDGRPLIVIARCYASLWNL